MTTFDKREEGFEKKFALDEEQKFKAEARRNKLLGLWAAEKLGLIGDAATAYSKEVVAADFEEAGDQDVQNKVVKDFTAKGVAVTAAGSARQDGRADGGSGRPGEGGDVLIANREWRIANRSIPFATSPFAIRSSSIPHERSPSIAAPPRSENPPRRVTVTTS